LIPRTQWSATRDSVDLTQIVDAPRHAQAIGHVDVGVDSRHDATTYFAGRTAKIWTLQSRGESDDGVVND
jgi:hypothetical protein